MMSLLPSRANPVSEVGWALGEEPTLCSQSGLLPPPDAHRKFRQMRFRPSWRFTAHLFGTEFSLEQMSKKQPRVIVRRLVWGAGRASRLSVCAGLLSPIDAPQLCTSILIGLLDQHKLHHRL